MINSTKPKYDLEERTALFGENTIKLIKTLPPLFYSVPIIIQLVKSSTSVGANYMEANGASSKKDFRHKISYCKKEIKETRHWFRMLTACYPSHEKQIGQLSQETDELTKIFSTIYSSVQGV